jgi:regulatory protein
VRKSGRIGSDKRVGTPKRRSRSSPVDWVQLAIKFLSRQDRTVAQVEQFLASKGASPIQVEQTVRCLSDLRYLNDRAYARRWADNRLASRPSGRERLKAELQAKGIAEAVADQVMADVFREIDEEVLAHRALEAVRRRGRRLTGLQTVHFLRRRGFSEETIDRMIRNNDINEASCP